MLPWDHLRFALAIARYGTMAGAARALSVDLTTVGRRLQALEEAAGATLFVRTHNGLLPTDAGRSVLHAAERMEEEMVRVQRALAPKGQGRGPVRIAALEDLAEHWLQESGSQLRRSLAGVELVLITAAPAVDLARGAADLAVDLVRPDGPGWTGRKLGALVYGLYAGRSYLAEHGRPRTPQDLAGHRVVLAAGSLERSEAGRWMARAARTAGAIALRTDSQALIRAGVASGLGVGLLPLGSEELAPELVRLAPLPEVAPRPVWLLMRREARRSPRVHRVAQTLEEALGAAYRRWQRRG
jgi:DNA-binding transcriptional LysR family regulator